MTEKTKTSRTSCILSLTTSSQIWQSYIPHHSDEKARLGDTRTLIQEHTQMPASESKASDTHPNPTIMTCLPLAYHGKESHFGWHVRWYWRLTWSLAFQRCQLTSNHWQDWPLCFPPEQQLTSSLSLLCNSQHSPIALRIKCSSCMPNVQIENLFHLYGKVYILLKNYWNNEMKQCCKFMTHEKRKKKKASARERACLKTKGTLLIPAAEQQEDCMTDRLYDRQKVLKVAGGHTHRSAHSRAFWGFRAILGTSKKPDLSGVIRMSAWQWLLTIPGGLSNHILHSSTPGEAWQNICPMCSRLSTA